MGLSVGLPCYVVVSPGTVRLVTLNESIGCEGVEGVQTSCDVWDGSVALFLVARL